MPVQVQHSQLTRDLVATQNFERDDAGVGQKITCNTAVEDLERTVVTGIGEQRVVRMVSDCANGFAVVSERLVGSVGQVHVVPEQTTVV